MKPKLIPIVTTHHIGGSTLHHVDSRVWAAYQRGTNIKRSRYEDDPGIGYLTLRDLNDRRSCVNLSEYR